MGTELDAATQARLDRGYRMVELLKQPQYKPMHVVDQVLTIYAGTKGHLDDVPIAEVRAWEEGFLGFVRQHKPGLWKTLDERKDVSAEVEAEIVSAIKEFKGRYAAAKKPA
jgi:F-type H+-transporting ATPase subunit alpha